LTPNDDYIGTPKTPLDRKTIVNQSKVIKRTVSIPRKLSEYADELQEHGAFSTFSSYIEDLIRRDWEKKSGMLPPRLPFADMGDDEEGTVPKTPLKLNPSGTLAQTKKKTA
jgi:hypothetical protein